MTRLALVLPFYTDRIATLEEMLSRHDLLRRLPPELAAHGYAVSVFVLATHDAEVIHEGVHYVAVRSHRPAVWLGRTMQRLRPSLGPAYWEPALRLARRVCATRPDVVHVFGLTLDVNLAFLVRAARQAGARVVVHFHGGEPSRGRRIRRLQGHTLARVERVLFTHREQARPWIEAGLLPGWDRVGQVVETSVDIAPVPRATARAITGIYGDPACLSVGRLHQIKDPMTMLRGFARVASARPDARLYLYFLTDEMLPEMRGLLAEQPEIADRVEFRGRATPEEMAAIYSSADLLLQASLREWSSLAVLEALSCGCIPIVSRIPAFETLTANGRYGRLFPTGDDAALADTILALNPQIRANLSDEVRDYFKRELSFPAMARRLDEVYARLTVDSS